MGQFSVEICPIAGSVLGETQHTDLKTGLTRDKCHQPAQPDEIASSFSM